MAFQLYRDLEVWTQAMDLVAECYRVTNAFPKDEVFGMTSQIPQFSTVRGPRMTVHGPRFQRRPDDGF